MKTLTTKARDNFGYEYTVTLTPDSRHLGKDWVLRIVDTPGSWFMTTLEEKPRTTISIDFGAKWDCINFGEVMAEAIAALAGEDRLTGEAAKKAEDDMWKALLRA